jgi:putative transposase
MYQWFGVTELCKLFGVSRSDFYAYIKRKGLDRDQPLKDLIQAVYKKYDGI